MSYIDGFVAAVPTGNRQAYIDHASKAADLFRAAGMTRAAEGWGDDVPHGEHTDFFRSVQAEDGETVVFAWLESPSKDIRDAAMAKMMDDPDMRDMDMPFDGKRMIFGGFAPILDEGGGRGGYADGFLLAVAHDKKQAYIDMAAKAAPVFLRHGALRHVEAWGDDLPDGKVTAFRRAVKAEAGENVIFSWIEWPDKATRDSGMAAAMADPEMSMPDPSTMPFDGKRMMFGGFQLILDR